MARFYLTFGMFIPLLQLACAVHAYRRGKDRFWFWVVLVFPLAGSAIYFFSEVLPGWRRSHKVLRWLESIPWFGARELDRLEDELEYAPTIENRLSLADACVKHGKRDRAIELYNECLKGTHAKDVYIRRSLAEALYAKEDWQGLLACAIELRPLLLERELNEAIRWEAIALDGLDRHAEAEDRYEHLIEILPGEEIRGRLAVMLARHGREAEARKHFEIIQRHLRRGNDFYRRQNREWSNSSTAWLKHFDRNAVAKK